jgi:hypothetical protein
MTPTRRALLKAAAAGGVFAVPLIASFAMDAPAQATPGRFIGSNMNSCSDHSPQVPTGFFIARVAGSGRSGRASGYVLLGIFGGSRPELIYQLVAPGVVDKLRVTGAGSILTIGNPGKRGTIPGSRITCSDRAGVAGAGLATLFDLLAESKMTAFVGLADGTDLSGPFTPVDEAERVVAEPRRPA